MSKLPYIRLALRVPYLQVSGECENEKENDHDHDREKVGKERVGARKRDWVAGRATTDAHK